MKLRNLLRGTPAHPPLVMTPDPRCTQITKKETRCKLPKSNGSDKCAIHGRQA